MSSVMERTGPEFDPSEHPHRRFNPLLESYVLVSPHRTKRPWNGQVDAPTVNDLPKHDDKCYLCPGNKRMGGQQNPDYEETFVFSNDFPALLDPPLPQLSSPEPSQGPDLFQQQPVMGSCQVICFHPRHDLTLARMPADAIRAVLREWSRVYIDEGQKLWAVGDEGYVQFFENRGAMMGASAPHPHGQVWSLNYVPQEPATELKSLQAYRKQSSSGCACLLCNYATQEVAKKERVVVLDEVNGWVAVVPWWATWPFEIMVLPYKRHIASILDLTEDEAMGLAETLRKVMVRYDNLFSTSFPYSMGLHQAPLPPTTSDDPAHLHLHFYPPLLRSASVRKFLVGFEMMAEAQRDLTPEQAAQRLRDLEEVHYLEKLRHNAGDSASPTPSSSSMGASAQPTIAPPTSTLPLADYASESDDEVELPIPPPKKQKRLPSLSAGFALGPPDDPSLHQGRTRTRPFVPGEYSGHVYLEVTPNKRLREALQAATDLCQTLMPERVVHHNTKLHISLTHPLPLRRSQLEPFKTALNGRMSTFDKFHISVVGQMVGFQNSLAREGDIIRGRAFLAIRVGAGHDVLERMLSTAIEPVLASLRLPAYHRKPMFHASIAWTLGDAIPSEVLQKINDRFEEKILQAQQGWEVDEVDIKISGHPIYSVGLGGKDL